MTVWQVIDLTGSELAGRASANRGHVLIDGQPVGHLEDALAILVREDAPLRISTSLYTAAAKAGVPAVYTDHFARPLAVMMPISGHTRVATRHRAQSELSRPRRKRAWQAIVQAKIKNQAVSVDDKVTADRLMEIAAGVKSGDTTNREAYASRLYWRAFTAMPFRRDTDGKDPINGALNYGYTVLRGAMARAVTAAGLWPTAGIHHKGRENAWCLVDDLMEPFRPVVDRASRQLDSFPSQEAKQQLVSSLQDKFDDTTTRVAIQEFAEAFALYVEEKVSELPEPRMRS